MNTAAMPLLPREESRKQFALFFQSLFNEGRGLAFPCDARGHVDIDELSERARTNYLYARAVVGREYAVPSVVPSALH